MFRYSFEQHCELSQDIINLLEQVDAFPFSQLSYSLGASLYQSLGDIHNSLENVDVRSDAGARTHTIRMTIQEIKKLLDKWYDEINRIKAHNNRIHQKMDQCQNQEEWKQLRKQLIPDDEWPRPLILERVLEEHANEPDNTEVDIEITHYLGGYYTRNSNQPVQGYVVLRYDTRTYPLVCTYIHEMMHAFYDADLSQPHNDAEYVEEPLAEFGMLHFVESFVRSHPEHSGMLTYAKDCVRKKQSNFGIAHYGFGAYLFENFSNIEWERLMRKAHSSIDNTTSLYAELKQKLEGVYPSQDNLPYTAQLLHDILTDSTNKCRKRIITTQRTTYIHVRSPFYVFNIPNNAEAVIQERYHNEVYIEQANGIANVYYTTPWGNEDREIVLSDIILRADVNTIILHLDKNVTQFPVIRARTLNARMSGLIKLSNILIDINNPYFFCDGIFVYDKIHNTIIGSIETETSMVVNDSVRRIERLGGFLWRGLIHSKSIFISKSVEDIAPGVFARCIELRDIHVDNNNKIYYCPNYSNAVIEKASNKLIAGCLNTIIPTDVKIIGYSAFAHSAIERITIPSNVEIIESYAFDMCMKLQYVELSYNIKDIYRQAFAQCNHLIEIIVPKGERARFSAMDGLRDLANKIKEK